jgi:hypothetical protein
VNESAAEAGQAQHATGDADRTVDQPEAVPVARRKRPRGKNNLNRLANVRSASGWRKVRLGLILIAISMCSTILWVVVLFTGEVFQFHLLGWYSLLRVLQALPLAGHLLCAFVPLKGTDRNLAVANLGVIAVSLALTIVADWFVQRAQADLAHSVEKSTTRSQELLNKLTAGNKEAAKQDEELRKQVAELRKKASAGDKEARKQAEELDKKGAEMRKKRAADDAAAMKQALADIQAASSIEPESFKLPWSMRFWAWIQGQSLMLTSYIQIIILSFFIQAIARALDVKDLAASCPRVAVLASLTLSLALLGSLVLPNAWFVSRLVFWITYILGLVSFVWQGHMLVEACKAIGNHLNP